MATTATATITREQLDDILDAAELYSPGDDYSDGGDDSVTVDASYSGRAMYGTVCLGVTVSGQGAAFRLAAGMAGVLGVDEAREILRSAATDSAGYGSGMVVYFPGLVLAG